MSKLLPFLYTKFFRLPGVPGHSCPPNMRNIHVAWRQQ